MSKISDELFEIADQLETLKNESDTPKISNSLHKLKTSAEQVQKSWCGSWLGHHSRIYYKDLKTPPLGARFSQIDGTRDSYLSDTFGDWREYNFDDIKEEIYRIAGNPNLGLSRKLSKKSIDVIEDKRSDIISLLTTFLISQDDPFISDLREKTKNFKILMKNDYINALRPTQVMTRDKVALGEGLQIPPHVDILVEILEIEGIFEDCKRLTLLAKKAASHIARQERYMQKNQEIGTNVFIGHGRSPVWKDFKDFIQDKLRLPWDEFNRVPIAGITNIARLSQMLDDAAIAFIIMTAEDELADGKISARMNVIHEVGLFQGRLGFTKAIVLLEAGCEEFSNIQGLGQIRFPKGNIKAIFEDIRQVVERENLLSN
jgi:predicted nucleotide-binding protein